MHIINIRLEMMKVQVMYLKAGTLSHEETEVGITAWLFLKLWVEEMVSRHEE